MKARPIQSPRRLDEKIVSPTALKRLIEASRKGRRPTRWVFTNGCFDILHQGHVRYLEQARGLGDRLIVALNTDASVRALKGPERPINPLRDRMDVMAALECVDFVVSFGSETPLRLIRALTPDVLVKGGDWKPEAMVGAAEVKGWGGSVHSIPFDHALSTTDIVTRIRGG